MDVVIAGGVRTPIGTFGGAFVDVSAQRLGATVVGEALKRTGVGPHQVDDVLMGNVLQAGLGMNVARQVAIEAGIPVDVPAVTVNQVCGSGLRAVAMAAQSVALGDARVVIAGGTENMSQAPYLLKQARFGYRMGNGELIDSMINEGLSCAIEQCHMGVTAENVADDLGISREDQDRFSAESQARTAQAMEQGRFRNEIVPVEVPQRKGPAVVVDKDEHPRAGTTVEKLAALKPAFRKDGTVTAGNASGINDGAAAMLVMSPGAAEQLGVQPMVRVLGYAWAGVEPRVMGLGPVSAIQRVLEKTGLKLSDFDLIELNEAFASQSVGVIRQLGLDPAIVNVNGGAVALGHPIGASGARILVTLMHEMVRRSARMGLASLCIGGGQGIAMAVERIAL